MGWTIQELRYTTLEQAKVKHVDSSTRYSEGITAELIAYEWHPETFFAIIRLSGGRYAQPKTFLQVDLIEQSAKSFSYKDGCEEMGMYCKNKPSRSFAALVYKHIPEAPGYAAEFRQRNGIKYNDPAQLSLLTA